MVGKKTKRICMLLNGDIKNDSRVIKVINSISTQYKVDLFYLSEEKAENFIDFNSNVMLYPQQLKRGLRYKIIQHSFFYRQYIFFSNVVLAQKKKYDFVYANDLPSLLPGIKIKNKTGAKLIYDAHEIYTETIPQFFPRNVTFIKKFIFRMNIIIMRALGFNAEKRFIKHVDYFVTVGSGLRDYFQKKYTRNDIIVLMNCPKTFKNQNKIDLHSMLGLSKNFKIFIYQGVLNNGRGLLLMVEAMKQINSNSALLILGDGVMKDELSQKIKQLNIGNKVFLLPKVPVKELLFYTSSAYCGLLILQPLNLNLKLAAPNKIFEYINANIPVITSYTYETNAVFSKYKIGLQTDNSANSIAEKIDYIARHKVDNYINNCKMAAMEYNWENQEKSLMQIFK